MKFTIRSLNDSFKNWCICYVNQNRNNHTVIENKNNANDDNEDDINNNENDDNSMKSEHTYLQDWFVCFYAAGELTYTLPLSSAHVFQTVFTELEKKQSQLGISSFGGSETTMEEVFIK